MRAATLASIRVLSSAAPRRKARKAKQAACAGHGSDQSAGVSLLAVSASAGGPASIGRDSEVSGSGARRHSTMSSSPPTAATSSAAAQRESDEASPRGFDPSITRLASFSHDWRLTPSAPARRSASARRSRTAAARCSAEAEAASAASAAPPPAAAWRSRCSSAHAKIFCAPWALASSEGSSARTLAAFRQADPRVATSSPATPMASSRDPTRASEAVESGISAPSFTKAGRRLPIAARARSAARASADEEFVRWLAITSACGRKAPGKYLGKSDVKRRAATTRGSFSASS
mmetsp:Transcript_34144/g.61442  ORF Transcript_34144/g.61442 Transcript_34144/m.61442 type:complete len:291 (+) Transcript_34144:1329-2201(+)